MASRSLSWCAICWHYGVTPLITFQVCRALARRVLQSLCESGVRWKISLLMPIRLVVRQVRISQSGVISCC